MARIIRSRGDTFSIPYNVISRATNAAIDITGATFLFTVDPEKAPVDASGNLFQIVGVIVDATAGQLDVPYTALEADVAIGDYYFDLQMTDQSGKVRTIDKDKYTVVQDITK